MDPPLHLFLLMGRYIQAQINPLSSVETWAECINPKSEMDPPLYLFLLMGRHFRAQINPLSSIETGAECINPKSEMDPPLHLFLLMGRYIQSQINLLSSIETWAECINPKSEMDPPLHLLILMGRYIQAQINPLSSIETWAECINPKSEMDPPLHLFLLMGRYLQAQINPLSLIETGAECINPKSEMDPPLPLFLFSLIYLIAILSFLHFLQTLIAHKLLINDSVHVKRTSQLPLRFRSDGTFKILQVADMHYGNGAATHCRDVLNSQFYTCSDLNTTQFVYKLIQIEKPDFVAFTGDNIFGPSATDAAESLFKAFSPVLSSGIPWAAVLGNHDQESTMTREELMSIISLMDYSVSRINPIGNIDGFGNYDIQVYGASGSPLANSSVLNLFFLDSGDRETVNGFRTYGWIKDSQLQWLTGAAEQFQKPKRNNHESTFISHTCPALTFFHIPIPEVRYLYGQNITGQFQEGVACSMVNSGVLNTLSSIVDIKAVFMGHDHKNDFCGKLEGIWFCYGGGAGYHGYGKAGWERRARVISAELEVIGSVWNGVGKIKTWKRLDDEKMSKIDEQQLWP